MKYLLLLVCFFGIRSHSFAQSVPKLINYQGRLTDESGSPLANGTYRLGFRIYTNALPIHGELPVWGADYEVTLANGSFNVILGQNSATAVTNVAFNDLAFAFSSEKRFLELQILRAPPNIEISQKILPRQQLLSTPFAFRADVARSLETESADLLTPPGTITAFGGVTPPPGWLLCDGKAVSSQQFPRLFWSISTNWGSGDLGSTNDFNLPDLRGRFLRGVDAGIGRDPDAGLRVAFNGDVIGDHVGSYQGDMFARHHHGTAISHPENNPSRQAWRSGSQVPPDASSVIWGVQAASAPAQNSESVGGNESRPKNAAVNLIIKY